MKEISADPKYNCPEPILYIMGGDHNSNCYISCSIYPNKECVMLQEDR